MGIVLSQVWIPASAQGQQSSSSATEEWHIGYQLFQVLLEERGIQSMRSLEASMSSPSDSLVIWMANRQTVTFEQWNRIRTFVDAGGNALVACDQYTAIPGIGSIVSESVTTNDPNHQYQGFADCVRIDRDGLSAELLPGVQSVIANRSGWLRLKDSRRSLPLEWSHLVRYPEGCLPSESSGKPLALLGKSLNPEGGTLILVADTSFFTNSMLWHGDNSKFAIRLAEILAKSRRGLTFMVDRHAQTSLAEKFKPQESRPEQRPKQPNLPQSTPDLDFETRLRIANHVIKSVEESNVVNELLKNQPRDVSPWNYQRAILFLFGVIATLLLLAYLLRRAPLAAKFRGFASAQSVIDLEAAQRPEERFRLAAFVLASEFFQQWTGTHDESQWEGYVIRFASDQKGEVNRTLARDLDFLLSYARRHIAVTVSESQLQSVGRTIQKLRQSMQVQDKPVLAPAQY